jgi:hypothetical protein
MVARALVLYDWLRAAGYPAEILPQRRGENTVYPVRIRQLAAEADAQAIVKRLRSEHDIPEPLVTR